MNIIEAWLSGWNQIANFFGDWTGIIWDSIISFLNSFLGGISDYISNWLSGIGLSITIPSGVFDVLDTLTRSIGYLIPVSAILPIPIFMLSFYILKLIFAIYQIIASTVIQRIKVKL